MRATLARLGLMALVPLLMVIGGCGWEPLVPPTDQPSPAQETREELTAVISYDCSTCVQSESSSEPMTFTFQGQVHLPAETEERVAVYNWDFGDGAKGTGKKVTHTFEDEGEYDVRLHVVTSNGRETSTSTSVSAQHPESPEPKVQHDVQEGSLCTIERTLPRKIRVGEAFQVEVRITANKDVRFVTWEDTTWFPQFRVQQNPTLVSYEMMEAGTQRTLIYDVKLWQTPEETDLWMEGFVKCHPGGWGKSEELTLRSDLNVVLPDGESQTPSEEPAMP